MLELIINGKAVDLGDDSLIALNKVYSNLDNPTKYYTEYSKTINIPFTANNNAIFTNWWRADSIVTLNTMDARKKQPFVLLYNKDLVLKGYVKLENANTAEIDRQYEITLYSKLAEIMNELSMLTFSPYDEKEAKYLIDNMLPSNLVVDRNIVKRSFQQDTHNLVSDDPIDWIGFIPSYQGKYPDFESNMIQLFDKSNEELTEERDEHYMREFRTYYQQPFVWVDKMWKMLQDKCSEITDYSLVLDDSWFNYNNPYYTDLIYTCPNLYNSDDNFKASVCTLEDSLAFEFATVDKSYLSANCSQPLAFNNDNQVDARLYNTETGVFNEGLCGYTEFTASTYVEICACNEGYGSNAWCRIRNDNPLYLRLVAVNAETNQVIPNSSVIYMFYSGDCVDYRNYDVKIDLGITERYNPSIPAGHNYYLSRGYYWGYDLDVTFKVLENVPYKIYGKFYTNFNETPFEQSLISTMPQYDSLWYDLWKTDDVHYNGMFMNWYVNAATVESVDYSRSYSPLSIYRIFSKDVTLLDALLNYTKTYGLIWDLDEYSKTLTVMTRDRFFSNYTIEDWSDKLDRSSLFEMKPCAFENKYVAFNVEEGDCYRLKKYQDRYKYGYGSYRLDTGYEFNKEDEKLYSGIQPSVIAQKAQASYYINTEYPNSMGYMGVHYKVNPLNEHYVDNDDEGSNANISGAFYFRRGTFQVDDKLSPKDYTGTPAVFISDDTKEMINSDQYVWNRTSRDTVITNVLPNVTTILDGYSVHFKEPMEYYFRQTETDVKYVFEAFWKEYINERYNLQNKVVTTHFYLTPADYRDFTFRKFIVVDNVLYHINKISDYNYELNGTTKVEMVQVWDINSYLNSQDTMDYIFSLPNVTLDQEYKPIEVFSSSAWHIASNSSWIIARITDNLLEARALAPSLTYRSGTIVVENESGTQFTIDCIQDTTMRNFIYVDNNNIQATSSGDTYYVNVVSRPKAIEVIECPSFVDVEIIPYISTIYQWRLAITVHNNPFNNQTERGGYVVLSNGLNTATIEITQFRTQASIYEEHHTAITLESGVPYQHSLTRAAMTDNNGTTVTGNATVTTSGPTVGDGSITITATLGEDETSGGGLIKEVSNDGRERLVTYNVGNVATVCTLTVTSDTDNIVITID